MLPAKLGEVLPRLALSTSLLKEKWLSPSLLLPEYRLRRMTLPRSQFFGDSNVVVNDMCFYEIGNSERRVSGNGEKGRMG